jgi:hypothetical protein
MWPLSVELAHMRTSYNFFQIYSTHLCSGIHIDMAIILKFIFTLFYSQTISSFIFFSIASKNKTETKKIAK